MIEKREAALPKTNRVAPFTVRTVAEFMSDNANEAMSTLGIADYDAGFADLQVERRTLRLANWVTQAALSQSGHRRFDQQTVNNFKLFTRDSDVLRWPPARIR